MTENPKPTNEQLTARPTSASTPPATDYSGQVRVGGPSALRDEGALAIRKLCVGPMHNNVYLLTCAGSGEQLLIDAAHDSPRLIDFVHEAGNSLSSIVTTHRHADHTGALVELAAATHATTMAGVNDACALPLAPDHALHHGDVITLGDQRIEVIELRGHTPGGIALLWRAPNGRAHLFTGDSLFPGGPGKTDSPDDFTSLMDDLESRVFQVLDDSTWVYPGHGDDTTVGAERPHLAQWRARGW